MIKVGFVGGGMVGEGHIAGMLSDNKVEVVGVADNSQAARGRMADSYGVATFSDYRQVLDKCDLLYICTPNDLHRPLALEAIAAGKHVICEKPLAMNASEAEAMLTAANKAGVRLFVSENFRFVPEIIKLREVISSGEIGKPYLCLSCFIGNEFDRMSDPNNWKCTKEKSGGGVIIDNGPHILDSLYWFFGEVDSIAAIGGRLVVQAENKEEDSAQITLRFKSGVLANLALTFAARHNGFPEGYMGAGVRYDVNGTEGSVHATLGLGVTVVRQSGSERIASSELQNPPLMDPDFISAILEDRKPIVDGSDGLYVMRMVDACYEAIAEQKTVSL